MVLREVRSNLASLVSPASGHQERPVLALSHGVPLRLRRGLEAVRAAVPEDQTGEGLKTPEAQ